jgi:hypothetical protein
MISQVVQTRVSALRESVGQMGLALQFPSEFEYYMVALELCNSDMGTEYYFIFPVLPSSISDSLNIPTNIKMTNGGTTVIKNTQFTPHDITLTGNFGRSLKVLLGPGGYQELISSFKDATGGVSSKSILSGAANVFDKKTKTGYGCCKLLEEIINQSRKLDDNGNQKHLILYNLSFGSSYFVEPLTLGFSQSQENNMVWSYQLPLKAIAPVDQYLSRSSDSGRSNTQLILDSYIQKRTTALANDLSSFVSSGVNKVL